MLPDDRPLQMPFCEWHDRNALRTIPFYIPFCRQTKHVLLLRVYSTSTTVRDNLASSSASGLSRIIGDAVVGPYPLPEKLTARRYRDFLESIYRYYLKLCPSYEAKVVVAARRLQRTVGKMPDGG